VRRLRTLLVGEEQYLPVYGGEAVHMGGDVAGRIRSAAYGFTVGRNLAFAYLPAEVREGDEAKVEIFGDLVTATVAADVLYDPSNERILA
jgi:glycine cleavage system aminomethyltransferase T